MFLGLQDPDPDPLVRGKDLAPDPSFDEILLEKYDFKTKFSKKILFSPCVIRKKYGIKFYFFTEERSRIQIRIHKSKVRIRGSRYVPS
jgi:hypothetical protein